MFSKNKLIVPAVLMLLAPALAACGGETSTATPATSGAEATATTAAPAASEATATTATSGGTEATATTATSGGTTGGTTSGQAFRWRAFDEPPTFDPALMEDFLAIDLGQNLYDSVTQFNPDTLKVEPALASSWDVTEGGKVYTFHMRQGAQFSNGDPVTADDVAWSWNRTLATNGAPYTFVMADIQGATDVIASAASTDTTKTKLTTATGIKVIDPNTLQVTLTQPSAYFLNETALWTYGVVNKKVVSQCPADKPSCFTETGKNLGAGSGAYYIDTWDHNQRLHFKINPNYWNKQEMPTVEVEIPIVKDTTTAQAQFENGQIDALDGPDAKDLNRIQSDAKLKDELKSVGQARSVWIGFNVNKAPFGPIGDKKADALRQAVSMGMDRQQIIDLALSGAAQPLTTLLPKGVPGYQDFQAYKFDPAAAKAKLAEAGYPGCQGLNLTYYTRDRDAEKAVGAQIQAQFRDNLGCNIQVQSVTWKDFLVAREAHQYDMAYGSWGQDYPDPQDWLYALFDSSQIEGEPGATGNGNTEYYKNAQFDKLVRDANAMADPTKQDERFKNYNQAEQMLLKDAPLVPLYQNVRYWEISSKWSGYNTNAQFVYPFRFVKPAK